MCTKTLEHCFLHRLLCVPAFTISIPTYLPTPRAAPSEPPPHPHRPQRSHHLHHPLSAIQAAFLLFCLLWWRGSPRPLPPPPSPLPPPPPRDKRLPCLRVGGTWRQPRNRARWPQATATGLPWAGRQCCRPCLVGPPVLRGPEMRPGCCVGPPFLLGVCGRASGMRSSFRVAPKTLPSGTPCGFGGPTRSASGGIPGTSGMLWRRLGSSLQLSDLQGSIKDHQRPQRGRTGAPFADDAAVRGASGVRHVQEHHQHKWSDGQPGPCREAVKNIYINIRMNI